MAEVRNGLPSLSRPLRLVRHRERAPTRGMQAFLALAPVGEHVAAV